MDKYEKAHRDHCDLQIEMINKKLEHLSQNPREGMDREEYVAILEKTKEHYVKLKENYEPTI